MANHDVWDAVAQTDGTPANSFEFLLRIQPGTGGAHVQTADVNNVNPAFTAKNRNRETYAAKGVDSANKYGENLVLTFDVEAVRDTNGAFQPVLQDLIDASKSLGAANRRSIQAFDALGADYAFQSQFAIQVSRTGTGYDEAAFFTVTATQYGATTWIDNPVLTGNVPFLTSVAPLSAAGAAHVFIQGEGFFLDGVADVIGASHVKFGSTNATSYTVLSDTLIDAVVPGTGAADLPITVENSAGVSNAIDFERTA